MAGEHPRAEGEAFGAWLRQNREVRGIELREIADSSKIGLAYLQAFEEERFDLLPAPVFAKGFLRQYAAYIGVDPEEAVNFYLSACRESRVDSDELPESQPGPPNRSSFRFVVLALGLALVLALVFWAIGRFGGSSSNGDGSPDRSPESPETTAPMAPEGAATQEPQTPPADDPGPTAATQPSTGVTTTLGNTEDLSSEEPSAPLRVVVDFSGECWVEATIDGVQRHAEIKVQGESLIMEAQESVDLKVGDARVVQVEVNGRAMMLPSRSGTSVRSVRIDRETLASLAPDALSEGDE